MNGIQFCFDFNLPFPHYNFVTYCQPKNVCSVASVQSLQKGKQLYFQVIGKWQNYMKQSADAVAVGEGDSWARVIP